MIQTREGEMFQQQKDGQNTRQRHDACTTDVFRKRSDSVHSKRSDSNLIHGVFQRTHTLEILESNKRYYPYISNWPKCGAEHFPYFPNSHCLLGSVFLWHLNGWGKKWDLKSLKPRSSIVRIWTYVSAWH